MNNKLLIRLSIIFLLSILLRINNTYSQSNLINQGTTWKYLDDGSNQGNSWTQSSFDDSNWEQGNAQLGFGDGDETTVLTSGFITYYFRRTFNVNNPNFSPTLLLNLLRDDGAVIYLNGTEVIRSNMPSGNINYLTLSSTTISGSEEDIFLDFLLSSSYLVAGDNVIAVEIHQRGSGSSDISFDLQLSFDDTSIIPSGSNWKYLDDGSNQGNNWKEIAYDDSSWSNGNAQLGYGDGDEQTVLSYGGNASNKYITSYFRQDFYVNNPNYMPTLSLNILRDDGAVVYLNGTEVARTNMPSGTINYQTFAAGTVGGNNENTFYEYIINSNTLVSGNNLIAVEIHQRSHTSSDISFDLSLDFLEVDYLRKAPYLLHTGDNTSAQILWQLYQSADCTLSWGTDSNYSDGSINSTEYGNDHQHNELISGLTPDTKYYYKVEVPGQTIESTFRTGVADNSASATFYAYGDTRTHPSHHNEVAEQIVLDYTANPLDQTFILSSGDIVANGNNESDWDNQFFDPSYPYIQEMLASLPYAVSIGNHAGQGVLFGKYFPYSIFESNRYYYSMDYGPVHFTVIDQFTDYSIGSQQYNWIVNDLAGTSKEWKIMMFHKPGWSAGGHSNDSQVQAVLQPLCLTYGVQVVISGHNHYYARAMVDGVIHITSGGGGAPLYTPNPNAENIVTVDKSYHYCKFTIQGDSLSCTVKRADGSIIETFGYSTYTPPAEPIEFNLKLYLEGGFNGTNLNTQMTSKIPVNQPYSSPPWNYTGEEHLDSIPDDMVDWVLVEIRDAQNSYQATPNTIVGTKAAILHSDGHIRDINGGPLTIDISYSHHPYIVIYHRNHLAIMSSSPPFDDDGVLTYDFTSSSGQVFGGLLGYKELYPGKWGMTGGDANSDGHIMLNDLTDRWEIDAAKQIYSNGDFDLNLQIDNKDKNDIWQNNINKESTIPQD